MKSKNGYRAKRCASQKYYHLSSHTNHLALYHLSSHINQLALYHLYSHTNQLALCILYDIYCTAIAKILNTSQVVHQGYT